MTKRLLEDEEEAFALIKRKLAKTSVSADSPDASSTSSDPDVTNHCAAAMASSSLAGPVPLLSPESCNVLIAFSLDFMPARPRIVRCFPASLSIGHIKEALLQDAEVAALGRPANLLNAADLVFLFNGASRLLVLQDSGTLMSLGLHPRVLIHVQLPQ